MEIKILSKLKEMTLALDTASGVDRETYNKTHTLVKTHMGSDAAMVLADSMEVGMAGELYFPNEGDGVKVWKRMKNAYKAENGLDNENI